MKPASDRRWDPKEVKDLGEGPSLSLMLTDPLQRQSLAVPAVFEEPVGDGPARICWDAWDTRTISRGVRQSECLVAFVQLHGKADHEIVRFAQRWGPLGICEHGKPYTHHPECMPLSASSRVWESDDESFAWTLDHLELGKGRPSRRFWEPLSAWRFYSQQFSALLWVARALADGRTPSPREWFAAFPWQEAVEYASLVAGDPYPPHARHTDWTELNVERLIANNARTGWEIFDGWMSRLARDARVTVVRRRSPGDARSHWNISFGQAPVSSPWSDELSLDSDSLFAVLTTQLGAMVDNPTRIYECSICHELVDRPVKRKPKPGEHILCSSPDCHRENRKRIRNASAAKRRAREREQRELARRSEPGSPLLQ